MSGSTCYERMITLRRAHFISLPTPPTVAGGYEDLSNVSISRQRLAVFSKPAVLLRAALGIQVASPWQRPPPLTLSRCER